jgi:hypothetical protein
MAHLDRSVATLRVAGDDLDPAEISALLGHAASKQHLVGWAEVRSPTDRRGKCWASLRQPNLLHSLALHYA